MGSSTRTFGQYEILRRLGSGGMAETFEARRQIGGTEQRVCLKRVLPAFSLDPKFNAQFLTEARLAASLRHSNIVSVLDFGSVDGSEFMVLELVDGLDLRALLGSLETHRLDAELVALIALDLAYALSYAHNAREAGLEGVVHRDISPSNVLISVQGEVKLADFGIAKAMTNAQATASGLMKGKIPYMSPEQMRAKGVDGRADLFSLGVSLYEALAGQRPFQGAHDVEVMTNLLAGDRRPLKQLAPDAPDALIDAIEGLLHIHPDERTATAELFVDAFSDCAPTPVARRRLAELVGQRGDLRGPRPGHQPTSAGLLDTELEGHSVPRITAGVAPKQAPKAVFKATLPATPSMIQAAEKARAAAAAMGAPAFGGGVPKSTVPSRPKALASSPPPAMPVPQGTMPATPGSKRARPAPAPEQATDTLSPSTERGVTTTAVALTTSPSPAADVRFPAEPVSDEVVLPVERPRLAVAIGVVGAVLLIGSATVFGLRARSSTAERSATAQDVATGAPALDSPARVAPEPAPRDPPAAAASAEIPSGVATPGGEEPLLGLSPPAPVRVTPRSRRAADVTAPSGRGAEASATQMASTMRTGAAPTTHTPEADGSNPPSTPAAPNAPSTTTPSEPDMTPRDGERGSTSGSVSIVVRSEPWGSVWVDGRYIGRSPATVVLPVGPHELGGGVGHIMGTRRVRVSSRPHQSFVVHVDYPGR